MSKDIIKEQPDFESDSYNDLLVIENKLEDMHKAGFINHYELALVDYLGSGMSFKTLQTILGIDRRTIKAHFESVCNRVAFALGGSFTDEGLFEEIKQANNLSDEDIDVMRAFISSPHKYNLIRSDWLHE